MTRWIVQFVYDGGEGKTQISHPKITVADKEEARELAAKVAPSGEYVFSIHSESDEQFLGAVRHKAMIISGKAIKGSEDDRQDS